MNTPNKNRKLNILHITHNDADAVGCALVLEFCLNVNEYHVEFNSVYGASESVKNHLEKMKSAIEENIEYDESSIDYRNLDLLVISDISSITKEMYDELMTVKNLYPNLMVYIFDHHNTNPLKDELYCIFESEMHYIDDNGKEGTRMISATKVMYDCLTGSSESFELKNNSWNDVYDVLKPVIDCRSTLFTNKNGSNRVVKGIFENLIMDISDYDVWEWKNHPRKRFHTLYQEDIISNACNTFGINMTYELLRDEIKKYTKSDTFDNLIIGINTILIPDVFMELTHVMDVRKRSMHDENVAMQKVRVIDSNGYVVALYISENEFSNRIADYILSTNDQIDYVEIIYVQSCRIGVRTKRDDIDLGKLMKRLYNGGGHPQAAGAEVPSEYIILLLSMYYAAPLLTVDSVTELIELLNEAK